MKIFTILLMTLFLNACTYYPAAPPTVSKFDQAWSAATGAFSDQGIHVTNQNHSAGIVQGTIDGANVKITLLSQPNGSVRVEFDTSGTTTHDHAMIKQIASSYNRRMGR